MSFAFADLNWIAIVVSIVVAQIISTLWFTVVFGEAWAKEYGSSSRQEHTKEVPGYTYAVGVISTAILVIAIALLQKALSITTLSGALSLGFVLAVGICAATMLPGQAFLRRYRVFAIAAGSQVVLILVVSMILGFWQ